MSDLPELGCWMVMHAMPGMGPVAFRRLLARFGTAREALNAASAAWLEVAGVTGALAEGLGRLPAQEEWAARMMDALLRRGVNIVRITDAAYPAALHDLMNPPPLLYLFGEVGAQDRRSVSMVGTTRPSDRGRTIAEGAAARLARKGITIVSGYAHGIDAASHRGAFNAGGRSILCVPFGIRRYTSRPDFPSMSELARRGAILSECPPEQPWSAAAAVARDRIIAALGRAVFVVETRPKGGTMHTVRAAEALGRPLFALRYREAPESARGNSILIARGAAPITSFADLGEISERVDRAMA